MKNNNYFTTNQVLPWLYAINDPMGMTCYLAVGEKYALLYDAGYGIGDLAAEVASITRKELIVVLGHGHYDHVGGAYQFDEVYIHEKDFELFRQHTGVATRQLNLDNFEKTTLTLPKSFNRNDYFNAAPKSIKFLNPNKTFDLGGIILRVIEMEGHTHGSIGLLEEEQQILLVSDAACLAIWMFLPESTSLDVYIAMLERVYKLNFKGFYYGHSDSLYEKEEIIKYINAAKNATKEKSQPYHLYKHLNPYIYKENGVSVVFR